MIDKMLALGCSVLCILSLGPDLRAQVYSPWVLKENQPDTRDLRRLTAQLCENAGAERDREKAEAIWRYLLTDGRFVEPGVFYHIAGWAYEEPMGEVLDPVKLLNSYGFGLCYQIAPLLEALWEAGGFQDARTWFLTGHTVTEVYFDGKYNMLDSDMLGYTTVGKGDPKNQPIASVRQLEQDERIILDKLLSADEADSSQVPDPWYPADVQARAMEGYAGLFSSQEDNWLFYFKRFPAGHTMDFVLRPGEKLIRYFGPESDGLFYLPYKSVASGLKEFPREIEQYAIETEDGPHCQKDGRRWATGRIEYRPLLSRNESFYPLFNKNLRLPKSSNEALSRQDPSLPAAAVFEMESPYVLISSEVKLETVLSSAAHRLIVATSVDGGRSWQYAGHLSGPFSGEWRIGPQVLGTSEHGVASAVSGKYGYLVRLILSGSESGEASVADLVLTSLIQLNPRTLPALESGENRLSFVPGPRRKRWSMPVEISRIGEFAVRLDAVEYVEEENNGLLVPQSAEEDGQIIFEVSAPDGSDLLGVDAGGRFLILNQLGPEKLTAETRRTALRQSSLNAGGSLAWAISPNGPWQVLWSYRPPSEWRDGEQIARLLLWPEIDKEIGGLPAGTHRVYVRYSLKAMALDDIRLAAYSPGGSEFSPVRITHEWYSRGAKRSQSLEIVNAVEPFDYVIHTGSLAGVENLSIVFECPDSSLR